MPGLLQPTKATPGRWPPKAVLSEEEGLDAGKDSSEGHDS